MGHPALMASLSRDSGNSHLVWASLQEGGSQAYRVLGRGPGPPTSALKAGRGGQKLQPTPSLESPPPTHRAGSSPGAPLPWGWGEQALAPPGHPLPPTPAPGRLLWFKGEGEGHPRSLGSRGKPREVTPFLNEIELPFSSSSQMSAALDQIRS